LPFTLSHPATAIAFWPAIRRGYLPLAAFAIGAMSPDFEFFLHLRPLARWSHSPSGLILFCLPAGLLVLAAWELVARGPVRHLLALDPEPTHSMHRDIRWWLRAVAAVVIGAATHLAWDGLTHGGYWGAQLMPALRAPAVSLFGSTVPWFNLLQHVSTAAGGVMVLGWLAGELRRAGALPVIIRSRWRWAAIATLVSVALVTGLSNGARGAVPTEYWSAQLWLGRVAVGALLGFGLALLSYSAGRRLGGPAADSRAI
jgi:hypothetical protein